jgi:hypothetical protein
MSIAGALRLPEPPDLLRRFVPTPFMVRGQMDGISFCIWTNDARYLRLRGKVVGKVVSTKPELYWTLVCDPDLPSGLEEPLVLEVENAKLLGFGRACFVAAHPKSKALSGFIAAGISPEEFAETVLPVALKLCAESADD